MVDLSVIITNYNKTPLIEYLIKYFDRHVRYNVEVILIDDASTEPISIEINKCLIIKNEKNMGIGYCRQLGLDKATGKYITYIDGDDIITEDYIDIILNSIKTNKDVYKFGVIEYPYGNLLNTDYSCISKVIKKDFIKENNLCFKYYRNGEDLYFCDKLYKCNPEIEIINKILYMYTYILDSESHASCVNY